jgi:hypothetical protein
MTEKYVYIDFEGYLTSGKLKKKIDKRIFELKCQGFNHDQIMIIVFEDSYFKECFLSNDNWIKMKTEYLKE